jgi:copper homeostasis protein (lipoprotein)
MNIAQKLTFLFFSFSLLLMACGGDQNAESNKSKVTIMKGLYSYGPEARSFTDCSEEGREFWVADSAKTLELAYSELGFEKPYTPVYIEVECKLIKSDTATVTGSYDSTMVVTKLIKISKQIPDGPCSQ